jgi:hypothetical protein
MSQVFTESVVEDAALASLEGLGYAVKHGPEIAPGEFLAKRRHLLQTMQQLDCGEYAENAYCCFEKSNRFQTGNSSTFAIDANELRKRLGNYRGYIGC